MTLSDQTYIEDLRQLAAALPLHATRAEDHGLDYLATRLRDAATCAAAGADSLEEHERFKENIR